MKTESDLYSALEKVLKAADEPMTCVDMYDRPEIRAHAQSANRVSDYLGGLWRKGLVERLPAPKSDDSRARWMYRWKPGSRPENNRAAATRLAIPGTPNGVLLQRPTLEIHDNGKEIVIELPSLRVKIETK